MFSCCMRLFWYLVKTYQDRRETASNKSVLYVRCFDENIKDPQVETFPKTYSERQTGRKTTQSDRASAPPKNSILYITDKTAQPCWCLVSNEYVNMIL